MSNRNKSTVILNDNDTSIVSDALLLIYNLTQQKIKSITFQNNNIGILNLGGSNNRIQIQFPTSLTRKFISEEEAEVINFLYYYFLFVTITIIFTIIFILKVNKIEELQKKLDHKLEEINHLNGTIKNLKSQINDLIKVSNYTN